MKPTPEEYQKMVQDASDPSPLWKNMLWAFVVGGAICTLGQGLLALWGSAGLDKTDAATV